MFTLMRSIRLVPDEMSLSLCVSCVCTCACLSLILPFIELEAKIAFNFITFLLTQIAKFIRKNE